MRRQTRFFSAMTMGAAIAVGLPAVGQEDSPQREQQQESQAEQQREDQQQRDREGQQEAESQQRNAQQRETDRDQQTPADPQRARENQQQRQQGDQQQQQQSDRQQRRAMLGVAFAQQDQAGQQQEGAQDQEGTRQQQEGTRQGLEIAAIMPGSAAEQANLQRGDVIVSADGQEIRSPEELDRIVQQRSVGDTLDLVVLRNDQRREMQVTLQAAPERDSQQGSRRPDFDRGAQANRGWLGVTLDTRADRQQGVTIERTYPAGPAARAGINAGDQILQVAGQQVANYDDVLQALSQTSPGESVDLVVAANGQQRQLSVRLDDAGVFAEAEEDFDSRYMWRDPSGRTAEIPEHDMMLEQHRRFAEQHERIESLLREVKQDLDQIKQQLNGGSAQRTQGQPPRQPEGQAPQRPGQEPQEAPQR